ncbi:MAG: type II toxin-antitoxin system RelB/DinJ family antitoxin [Neisseriaceae bacterium]|nr:type II toxin-antitoxin system RelB/DinJ family antitoxin [Neisseriaceae bacterium]
MSASTSFNLRLDKDLKEKSFAVIERYGLTPSQAIKLFLKQVAESYALPLSFNYQAAEPNKETQQAMLAARENRKSGNLKGYHSVQEMYDDLKKEFAND